MKEKEVKQTVKKAYSKIARESGSCCGEGGSCCCGDSKDLQEISKSIGYSAEELSEAQKNDKTLVCGCVGGALLKEDYIDKMRQAGFKVKIIAEDKDISKTQYGGIALESLKVDATKKCN